MNKNSPNPSTLKMMKEIVSGEIIIPYDAHYDLRSPGCFRRTLEESMSVEDFQMGCPSRGVKDKPELANEEGKSVPCKPHMGRLMWQVEHGTSKEWGTFQNGWSVELGTSRGG